MYWADTGDGKMESIPISGLQGSYYIFYIYIYFPLFPILDLKPKKKPFKGKVINFKKHVKKKHVPFSHKSINDFRERTLDPKIHES
jgi:hypothetical protein